MRGWEEVKSRAALAELKLKYLGRLDEREQEKRESWMKVRNERKWGQREVLVRRRRGSWVESKCN